MRRHCCAELDGHLQVIAEPSEASPDRPVSYDPVFDEYLLGAGAAGLPVRIVVCPWCGHRLPASKRDRWYAELDRLGLDPDDPELPPALHSDAWWASGDTS
jgi:hypothetical protein